MKKEKSNSLLKDSAIIFAASMAANILNYVFQLYMGRALSPRGCAIFASAGDLSAPAPRPL